ncbi:RAD26-like SNF2 family DNA-dependent ATPase [Mycena indigotica]|uniref:RAD26-like SNF2 family DNA-dependent ATPase n=1 Tax=Mycena indigotica TaxID=2126181 RepID=A0A8H6TCR7_9AGAR|nr:RAD26-like SNF2 family DNA-dependent ATPase [Mycena indigotica]KAF7315051.1 RAD26-like SNF2 family DNA-dependent ATPase [Mycena indigotica]
MAPAKGSAYSKRICILHSSLPADAFEGTINSIAAPIEIDSDSDFNAGPIRKDDLDKRKKRKTKKPVSSRHKTTPRETPESFEDSEQEPPTKKRRTSRKQESRKQLHPYGPSPLLAYFKDSDAESNDDEHQPERERDTNLALEPDRARKPEPDYEADNDRSEEEEEEESDDSDDDGDNEPPKSMFSGYVKPKPQVGKTENHDPENSETESDDEMPSSLPKSKPLSDDSVTESDNEPEEAASQTESDDDIDVDYGPPRPKQRPLPNFPLAEGQEPMGALILDKSQGIRVPGAINTYLRPYQRDGIKFFWDRYNENRGALLGDDMGLVCALYHMLGNRLDVVGALCSRVRKTIQVISLLSAVMKKSGHKTDRERRRNHVMELQDGPQWAKHRKLPPANEKWPTALIIAPSSVVYNWDREFEKWGYFEGKISVVHIGPEQQRREVLEDFKLGRLDVGKLGTAKEWKFYVTDPLAMSQSSTATDVQQYRGRRVAMILKHRLLPLHFLRRTKEDVIAASMPKKTDQVVFCPLSEKQTEIYTKILAHPEIKLVLKRNNPCSCHSGKARGKCCHPYDKASVFRFLAVLLKLSNHLGLILPAPGDSPEQLQRNRELAAFAFPGGNAPSFQMAIMDANYCGKWTVLMSLLKEWRQDTEAKNKVLIFTKSVKLLDMMSFQLKMESISYIQLDGSTKGEDRMKLIDDFHNESKDIFVFLISILAGGTGLNLTGANKVVIFDPNWNPAHDLQAMDRAFRLGQKRDVSVFRLLGAGAIEELIYARQLYKQQQMQIGYSASIQTRYFEGVQGNSAKQGELFGLNNIFKLHDQGESTKHRIENAYIAQLDWKLKNARPGKKSKNDMDLDMAGMEGADGDDFAGLGALLFSEALPQQEEMPVPSTSKDAMAGMYVHENPDVLAPSKIEEERTAALEKRMRRESKKKKMKSAAADREGSPQEQWPPIRVHKKARLSSPASEDIRFEDRLHALIGTGIIDNPRELASFAQRFARYSPAEQASTLAILNNWTANAPDESDDEGVMSVDSEPEDI